MDFRQTLLAFGVLMVLGLVVILTAPSGQVPDRPLLLPGFVPDAFLEMELGRRDARTRLVRREGRWWLDGEPGQAADGRAIEDFLLRLQSARIIEEWPDEDPSRPGFGLGTDEAAFYRLTGSDGSIEFRVGRSVPGGGAAYLYCRNRVMIADAGLATLARRGAQALRRRNLFDWMPDDIDDWQFLGTDPVRFRRAADGEWRMFYREQRYRASRRRVEEYLDRLLSLEDGGDLNRGDRLQPLGRFLLTHDSASQEVVLLGQPDGGLVWQRPTGGLIRCEGAGAGDLAFRREDFRATVLLDFNIFRVGSLEIVRPDGRVSRLRRENSGWREQRDGEDERRRPEGSLDENLLRLATLPVLSYRDDETRNDEAGWFLRLSIPPGPRITELFLPSSSLDRAFSSDEPGALLLDATAAVQLRQTLEDLCPAFVPEASEP